MLGRSRASPGHTARGPALPRPQHHSRSQPRPLHPAGRGGRQRLQQHPAGRAGRRGGRGPGTAAGQPRMGGEALALPPAPAGAPAHPGSHRVGANAVLSPYLQTVVRQGLGPRARELWANSSGLGEAALGEQRRLDRGECRPHLHVRALRGPSGSGQCVGVCGGHARQGGGCPVWESCAPLTRRVRAKATAP